MMVIDLASKMYIGNRQNFLRRKGVFIKTVAAMIERFHINSLAQKEARRPQSNSDGGRDRIRTCEAINLLVFKTSAINHSATLP